MRKLILVLLIFLVIPLVNAYDNETVQICGGDEQTIFLCVGDLENSPFGKSFYVAPNVTGRTGNLLSAVSSGFDTGFICNLTRDFLIDNKTTRQELLFKINNESNIPISQSVLDQYIDDFEIKCNMTIEQEREIVKKVSFPLILILLIILGVYSYYHREKIKKWLIALFDDDEEYEENDLKDEDEDLIEYVKGD